MRPFIIPHPLPQTCLLHLLLMLCLVICSPEFPLHGIAVRGELCISHRRCWSFTSELCCPSLCLAGAQSQASGINSAAANALLIQQHYARLQQQQQQAQQQQQQQQQQLQHPRPAASQPPYPYSYTPAQPVAGIERAHVFCMVMIFDESQRTCRWSFILGLKCIRLK